MRFVRFSPVGGASGDMVLAALAGLGADLNKVEADLKAILPDPFHIRTETVSSHGLQGIRVRVELDGAGHVHHHDQGHDSHHPAKHIHGHSHGRVHAGDAHAHRSFADIRGLIGAGDLPDAVREDAIRIFRRLAEAEGRVHGRPADQVHFHEVGATDSMVDILGACLALHQLGVTRVAVDLPLPTGSGTVTCAHGVYPVPPPAVVDLLQGYPVTPTEVVGEMLTPTGAVLLVDGMERGPVPAAGRLLTAANAFGHREYGPGRPNLLRACLLESAEVPAGSDECLVMETNIDDLSGEGLGILMERLRAAGALDVYGVPVQMKKHRPGTLVGVIARPGDRDRLLDVFFREGTTLGVREHRAARTCLPRRHETVSTPYGPVRVKIGSWRGEDVIRAPEMEDCIARANEHGVPPRRVYEAAVGAAGRPGPVS